MTAPRILLTGFEPFGGEAVNPSWLLAQSLDGEVVGSASVVAVQLPCVFGESLRVLDAALKRHAPKLVLALGQVGGRAEITPERVAIGIDDARIPDNAGQQPIDRAIVPGGPAAYFSSLPVKAMVLAMQEAGVPAAVSQTAGTFVCNHVFYGLMRTLRRRRSLRGGFMHVPLLPDQAAALAGQPSLPFETQQRALRAALHAAWHTQADIVRSGGAEA